MKPDRCANRQTDSSSTQRRRGGLQRDVRECVNPHGVAFPLWISVRLNFSRVGWQGAIGHSVNVSGSEQPEPRQPCAVACHSHSSLSILLFFVSVWELFIFSSPSPSSVIPPTLSLSLLSFTFALPLPAGI